VKKMKKKELHAAVEVNEGSLLRPPAGGQAATVFGQKDNGGPFIPKRVSKRQVIGVGME
jgi:hypothetical protein